MPKQADDGFDSHRKILTAMLHECGAWEVREKKAALIVRRLAKADMLTPGKPRAGSSARERSVRIGEVAGLIPARSTI